MNEPSILTERIDYSKIYTEKILKRIKRKKGDVLDEIEDLNDVDETKIYPNQEEIGNNVVNIFKDRKIIACMVLSKTQSGKTGSMCAMIKKYLEDPSNIIPIENIYIITGLSSTEWKSQTKERMPESIQSNVFHRAELPITFVDEIRNKHNILIIMDEIQIAAIKKQTIYNTFEKAGFLNKQFLYEKDIKIVQYTATPDGLIYDLEKWKDASAKILAEPGKGYVSAYDLLSMGRIKQFKDLCGFNKQKNEIDQNVLKNVIELLQDIEKYPDPRYHIIRTKVYPDDRITKENIIDRYPKYSENYNVKYYDGENDIENINNLLKTPPDKHTLIFIKEMLRCAKTLHKKYLGILYERYTKNPDDAVIIQGLCGRDTGYDNNGSTICYTNIDSIKRYEELWKNNFEVIENINWNSKTTKNLKGKLTGGNTFNDSKCYGFSSEDSDSEDNEIECAEYKTLEEVNEILKIIGKETGETIRFKPPTKKEGFYVRNLIGGDDSKGGKVISYNEAINFTKKHTERGGCKTRYTPCYRDINDKNTLCFIVPISKELNSKLNLKNVIKILN